jgi:hypothetical protein
MRALLVFESMFGNTQVIAKAVADGLSSSMSIDLVEVGAAPTLIGDDIDLLVVGGPTHAFGMSRATTRQNAADQSEGSLVSRGIGLREWLGRIQAGSVRVGAAAFDTRINKPLPGSAARGAEKRLRRLGFRVIAPAESFFVEGTKGPIVDGETERARRWGERLGAEAQVIETASPGRAMVLEQRVPRGVGRT